jgi:DNA mismatch repair ATPase MutS
LEVYVLITIVIILLLIIYTYLVQAKKHKKRERLLKIIEENWNIIKEEEHDFSYIDYLYKIYKHQDNNGSMKVDDITWNDFEMDGVFDKLNYTYSTMGEIYLYHMLRNPTNDISILKERDRIIEYYSNNAKDRVIKQYQLNNIGKFNKVSIYEYRKLIEAIQRFNISWHVIIPLFQLFSILILVINSNLGIPLFVAALTINLLSYYKRSNKIEPYLPVIMQIGSLLEAIKDMNDMQGNEELNEYSNILSKISELTKSYKRYYRFFGSLTFGKIPDIDMLYDTIIKPFLHTDIIVFLKLINFIRNNMSALIEAYETVGFLDSMIAISAFRHKVLELQGEYICKPDFCTHKLCYIAQDIYNPLIIRPVTNSLNTVDSILITGSNATGKSTFLRTIGLNAILAQTIYTVCAKSYSASFFTIMSSMSLRDNIYSGESYYMMEIKALKRILDAINAETPILCCIDEVLRGTNTIERIAASSKILESLAKSNVLCLVASHDLELTYIVEECYKNYHFQENVDSYGVVCDFKLYSGRSYTRNAINLLKFMGYSEDIIEDAKSRANNYISSGKWT